MSGRRTARRAARADTAERALQVPQDAEGRLLFADPHWAANQAVAIRARAEVVGDIMAHADLHDLLDAQDAAEAALWDLLLRCTPEARQAAAAAVKAVFE